MFVISVNYIAPIEHIEMHLAAHRAFLAAHYERGVFLMSGPQVPRTGGVILAHGVSRAEVEELVRQDPFHQAGVARYDVTEFAPNMSAPALAAYKAA
jgi:uncharacterized protein YciI